MIACDLVVAASRDCTALLDPEGSRCVVDTHVTRLAQRWKLTAEAKPEKIERDLMELIPESKWTRFSHAAIFHGRLICDARRPRCEVCALPPDCPYPEREESRR